MTDLPVKTIMELTEAVELDGTEWMEVIQLGNSRRFRVIPRTSPRFQGQPEVPTGDGSNPEMIVNFEALQNALEEALGVPAKPTGVALAAHTAIDEDGKTHLYVLVTFTPVSGLPRAHYEIKYSDDDTHYPGFQTKDPEAAFPARSGIEYKVKVRTISPEGVQSDWTDPISITPSKKTTLPTIPSGLSAVGGVHRNKIYWDKSEDRDYAFTIVYGSDTDNFLTASPVAKVHGDEAIDDGLPNNTFYYYWIVHVDRSGNMSNKFPVTNTGGISAKTKRIVDDDTDDTPPNAPTGLASVQRTKLDDDGKVVLYLVLTWNAPSGASAKISYEVKVTDDDGDLDRKNTKDRRKVIPVRSGVEYSLYVRAVTFNNVNGDWSSVLTITPDKKLTLPAAPTGLTVDAGFKQNKLAWPKSTDKDFKEAIIYRADGVNNFSSSVEVGRTAGTVFVDHKLTNGTNYYYWITFVDTTRNESTRWPVSSTAGVVGQPLKVVDGDTDDTAPGTPTGLAAVQHTKIDEDGKAVLYLVLTWNAPSGGSSKLHYELKVVDEDGDADRPKSTDRLKSIQVRSNIAYSIYVRALSFNNVQGSWSSVLNVTPSKKSTAPTTASGLTVKANHKRNKLRWTKCPDKDYKTTNIYRSLTNSFPGSGGLIDSQSGTVFIDDDIAVGTQYYYWVAHVDNSGNIGTASSSATDTIPGLGDSDIDDTAPGVPTGLASVQRTKLDEDGKAVLYLVLTWNAPSGATDKTHYQLKVTDDDGDLDRKTVTERVAMIKVRSNVAYSIYVCALSFANVPGTYTSALNVTPSKKSTAPTTAAGLVVKTNHKRNKLRWTQCPDTDWKTTNIYRNTTNVFPGSGGLLDTQKASVFIDDDIAIGTQYYYWVAHVDNSGNIGTASSVASDSPIPAIKEGDADSTAPSTPSSANLTLSQVQRRDKDGPIKSYLRGVFTTTGYSVNTRYKFNVSDGVGNTWAVDSKDGIFHHPAEVGLTYSVTVVAISFADIASTASGAVTKLITAKAADISSPAGLAISSAHKRNEVSWTAVNDTTFPDYMITEVYRNTSNTTPTPGSTTPYRKTKSSHIVDAALDTTTLYYYWIAHRDTSGNYTAVSGVVSGTGLKIQTADVNVNAITESLTDNAAPSTPSSANLTLSQVQRRDKDGPIKSYLRGVFTTTGYSTNTHYKFNVSDGVGNTWTVDSQDGIFHHSAEVGLTYSVTVVAISFSGIPSTASGAVTKLITAKAADISSPAGLAITSSHRRNEVSWTAVNDTTFPDYMVTEVYRNTVNTTPTPGSTTPYRKAKSSHIVDAALDTSTLYYYWIAHRDTSGNYTAVSSVVSGTGLQILTADLGPDSVKDANIAVSDAGNLVRNKNCDDITLWTTNTGTLATAGTSQVAEGTNRLSCGASTSMVEIDGGIDIPVKQNKKYYAEIVGGASDLATSLAAIALSINWYSMNNAGVKTLLSNTVVQTGSGVLTTLSGRVTAPTNARRAQIVLQKTSAENMGLSLLGPVFKKAASTEMIPDGDLTEIKADATAPATPSSANLTLSQIQRRDKDGSIKTYLRGVFTTTGYSGNTRYKFNVNDGTNTWPVDSKDGSFHWPAEVGLTYSVTVVAISFSDVPSTASSAVTKLITAKAADISAPAGLAISSAHKRNEVSWTAVNDTTYPDYMITEVYRNTVNTTPTPGSTTPYRKTKTSHIVDAALDTSTLYYYWIAHRDTSGNYTSVSSVVSGTGQYIADADITGQLDYQRMKQNAAANHVRNPLFAAGSSSGWNIGTGGSVIARAACPIAGAPAEYVGKFTANSSFIDFWVGNPIDEFEVTAGEVYAVRFSAAAQSIAGSSTIRAAMRFYNGSGDGVPGFVAAVGIDLPTLSAAGTWQEVTGFITVPATVNSLPTAKANMYMEIPNTVTGGTAYFAKLRIRRASDSEIISDNAVIEAKTDSTVPSTPSSANLTLSQVQRRDKDGSIKTYLRGVFTTTGYSSRTRYKFNVSDGTNTWPVDSKDGSFHFSAEVGLTYSVTVVAISFSDVPSTASSAVTKLITAKAADISAPAGLAIASAHKRNEVSWTAVNDTTYPDYMITEVYRNTVNTTPTPGSTTPYRKTKTSHIVDAALDTSTLYYYWIAHRDTSGNYTSVSGVVSGTGQKIVTADMTTGSIGGDELAITDLASNGENLDLSLGQVSWSATADVANDPTNAFKGTYVLKRAYTGSASNYVNRNAMWFACREGEQWYIGGMVKKDGSFAGTNLGFRISWCDASKTEVGTSNLPAASLVGTSWSEVAALVTVPSGIGAAFGRVEFAVYGQTAGTAFGSHGYARNAVVEGVTDKTAPATPSSANLTLSQVQRRDKDGSIKTYLRGVFTTTGYSNSTRYKFNISDGTNTWARDSKDGSFHVPAEVGLTYSVTVVAISFADISSTASSAVTKLITAKAADISAPAGLAISSAQKRNEVSWTPVNDTTYPDYMVTEVYRNTTNTTPTPGTTTPYRKTKGSHIIDGALDTTTLYYYWIAHKDTSGNYTSVSGVVSGTGQLIQAADYAASSVGSAAIAANNVTVGYSAAPSGSLSLTGTVVTTAATLSSVDFTNAYNVWVYVEFTNLDGSFGRNFDIQIYDTSNSAYLLNRTGINVNNNGIVNVMVPYTPPGNGPYNYELRVTCPNNTTIAGRRFMMIVFKR